MPGTIIACMGAPPLRFGFATPLPSETEEELEWKPRDGPGRSMLAVAGRDESEKLLSLLSNESVDADF